MPQVLTPSLAPPERETALAFGPFQLDTRRKVLLRHGAPVRLGGRAIDLLLALVRQPGRLLSQRELVAQVWPDTIVEDSSLRVHVAALRKALGDGADGRNYIGNVPGRGYRFLAQVQARMDGEPAEGAVAVMAAATATATAAAAAAAGKASVPESPVRLCRIADGARLSSIIGRAQDMACVAERLRLHRLVNLVGPGGVGKSTLALAVAATSHERFPGGAFYLDLGQAHHLDGLIGEIEFTVRTKYDQANGGTAGAQQLLLVLDNCEHVVVAAAAAAERLLPAMAGLTMLVTSREPLLVDGECLRRVAPLGLPPVAPQDGAQPPAYPALQLFLERARQVGHAFEPDRANLQLAAAICRRLDGLPLALEIAAAGSATLGLGGVIDQLERQPMLLNRARRNGPAHQDSLQASYQWSYRLLPPPEQTLFRRLGLFDESFSLSSACAIAADAGLTATQLTRALMSLVAKSLVLADFQAAETRYRLLNTARAYALELLAQASPPRLANGDVAFTTIHQTSLD